MDFSGLAGTIGGFVAKYAQLTFPLTELLKKNAYKVDWRGKISFEKLKRGMTQTPVLALPDFSKPFVVETDASNKGVGAVLTQNGHPIDSFSKKLGKELSLASAYIRELYAVTQAIAKWQHYLLGC